MPVAHNGDVAVRYEAAGEGPPLVFCGEPAFGGWQFGWQYRAVAGRFRAVVPDPRGAGRSDAPEGPYDLTDLAGDLAAVRRAAGARGSHLVGYGLGGTVALAHVLDGGRADSVTVIGTPAAAAGLDADALWAPPGDEDALTASLERALSAGFRERQPAVLDRIRAWRAAEDAREAPREAQLAAFEGIDLSDRLHEMTVPTLVVHGVGDGICPPRHGEALAEGLPRGEFHPVEGAGHLVGVEASRVVNDRLVGWLETHG